MFAPRDFQGFKSTRSPRRVLVSSFLHFVQKWTRRESREQSEWDVGESTND